MNDKKGATETKEYIFKDSIESDKKLCIEWYSYLTQNSYLSWGIVLLMSLTCNGAELIIGFGSENISRPRNF